MNASTLPIPNKNSRDVKDARADRGFRWLVTGAGMLVMIGVVLDRSTPDSFAAFEKAAAKVSGCMECHVVTGEFDYFMLVRTRDNDSFNRLHAEQLLYLPGVRQVRSFMVLRNVLSTTELPLTA